VKRKLQRLQGFCQIARFGHKCLGSQLSANMAVVVLGVFCFCCLPKLTLEAQTALQMSNLTLNGQEQVIASGFGSCQTQLPGQA
jgi:hypothetical protein